MRSLQKHLFAFAVAILFALALPTMRADEWTKRTVITINDPIQLPTVVLQPGTYVMKLLDSPSNRDIVQIFDQNEQHLITTILALPNYRLLTLRYTERFQAQDMDQVQPMPSGITGGVRLVSR